MTTQQYAYKCNNLATIQKHIVFQIVNYCSIVITVSIQQRKLCLLVIQYEKVLFRFVMFIVTALTDGDRWNFG